MDVPFREPRHQHNDLRHCQQGATKLSAHFSISARVPASFAASIRVAVISWLQVIVVYTMAAAARWFPAAMPETFLSNVFSKFGRGVSCVRSVDCLSLFL